MIFGTTYSTDTACGMQEGGAELSVADVSVRRRLSFLDYMAGGCEIQCMLAVDFSAENAPIDDPNSFHYAGELPVVIHQ